VIEFLDSLDLLPEQWAAIGLAGLAATAWLIDAFRQVFLQVAQAFGRIAEELAEDDQEGAR
jgi:hypothetical protein